VVLILSGSVETPQLGEK